jgi:DNA-binding beta-propeller fold protein YncE
MTPVTRIQGLKRSEGGLLIWLWYRISRTALQECRRQFVRRAEDILTVVSRLTHMRNSLCLALAVLTVVAASKCSDVARVSVGHPPSVEAVSTDLGVMKSPAGIAFDGANIWVAGDGRITKIRASDGFRIGTYDVDSGPLAATYDGLNIWVANFSADDLSKIRASDGKHLATWATDHNPEGLAFDGDNIWVGNCGANTVTVMRSSDGSTVATIPIKGCPNGLTLDGKNVWVSSFTAGIVSRIRVRDRKVTGTFAVGTGPHGITFDGENVWVANGFCPPRFSVEPLAVIDLPTNPLRNTARLTTSQIEDACRMGRTSSHTVTKLRARDGKTLATIQVGLTPRGMAFDGKNIWVANSGSDSVMRIRPSDGAITGTFSVGPAPRSILFDGASIWVTNSGGNTVTRLQSSGTCKDRNQC